MIDKLGVALRACALLGVSLWLAACGDSDESGASETATTVLIAVSESRATPGIGGTEPSGVFLVVRYMLANGADEDIVASQDDFYLVLSNGTVLARSEPGTSAWERDPGGYELTENVLLKPGGMPRPWVSVFAVPQVHAGGPWTLRYKDEPSVSVPAPSFFPPVKSR